MATTPNSKPVLTPAPSVSVIETMARMLFHHVMDSYGISIMGRRDISRPQAIPDWDGPGRHAIVWEFEVNGEPWISRIGDLHFVDQWLEPSTHYAVIVHRKQDSAQRIK